MSPAAVLILGVGIALIAVAASQARGPYRRYMALRVQEQNLARYDAWRGGRSTAAAGAGPSSAELMQRQLRGQLGRWAALGLAGFVLVVASLMLD